MPALTTAMIAYIYTLTAVLGLCMGSFLNCFAYRYAKGESVMKGRSKCALCNHTLSALDLLPVLSWLFIGGKCRYCGARISPRYLIAELVCGAAFVSVLFRFGFSPETLKFWVLAALLFAAAFTDVYCGLIPDRLTVIGAVSAFLFAAFTSGGAAASVLQTLINGLSVSLPLFIIVLVYDKLSQKETMGGGDIKLMFLIGLYFDWKLNILILILACVTGIAFALIKRPDRGSDGRPGAFPFAPAMALAAWCGMLKGEEMLNWYLGFFVL